MTATRLSASSRFLVGVATAIICLQFLVHLCVPFPDPFSVENYTHFDHLKIWLLRGLGSLRMPALVMLAVWVGQSLQRAVPNPGRGVRVVLYALSALLLVLYIWGRYTYYLPPGYMGCCLVWAMVIGFLVHPDRIKPHDTAELVIIVLGLTFTYIAISNAMDRHRWADFPAILTFSYYILLLANAPEVQRRMDGRWVRPTLVTLSVLSFAAVLSSLLQIHWLLSAHYLLPVWAVLVQPFVICSFTQLFGKKRRQQA